MNFKDVIILGPTSSGKSDLANFLATQLNIPVFNCDSVQVYEGLDILSNKPKFIVQRENDGEVVSFTKPQGVLDFSRYQDFSFQIISKKNSDQTSVEINDYKELVKFFEKKEIISKEIKTFDENITNYLFDIKKPLESYSIAEFKANISRVISKENINSKILVGGTIYYAYHYVFGTDITLDNVEIANADSKFNDLESEEIIAFIKDKDPRLLEIIDLENKSRLVKAAQYILETGKTFSEDYFKDKKPLDDFLLILILPKSREEYVKKLDLIVENRMNVTAIDEIKNLEKAYGEDVCRWLSDISYEYKYAVEIYNLYKNKESLAPISRLIDELKAKERQYTKRQITFIKKIVRELL